MILNDKARRFLGMDLSVTDSLCRAITKGDLLEKREKGLMPPENVRRETFICCFGLYCLNLLSFFPGFDAESATLKGVSAPLFDLFYNDRVTYVNWLERKKTVNTSPEFLEKIMENKTVRLFACFSHFEVNKESVTLREALEGIMTYREKGGKKVIIGLCDLAIKKRGDRTLFLARLEEVWTKIPTPEVSSDEGGDRESEAVLDEYEAVADQEQVSGGQDQVSGDRSENLMPAPPSIPMYNFQLQPSQT